MLDMAKQPLYFIPEWDDLVDPEFDFQNEMRQTGAEASKAYAHELYGQGNYDGILVSRVVAETPKAKRDAINRLGVHGYLRWGGRVFGDCGAFDYIEADEPPFTTPDILDYYSRLGFDYGVSIDHLIVSATEGQRQRRYDLTLHNADDFLREHRARRLSWEPVGAVQGWNPESYAEAARQVAGMGYRYIAIGGLVRSSTPEITAVLAAVRAAISPAVKVHLFGVARLDAIRTWAELGADSVDCAGPLRQAWLSAQKNYLTLDGKGYAALRIPQPEANPRVMRRIRAGDVSHETALRLEARALAAVRAYDCGHETIENTLEALSAMDHLIDPDRPDHTQHYRRTLEEMPWKKCPCDICRAAGVEVIIFRGNNRNRRRGFHNTWTFYRLLREAFNGTAPAPSLVAQEVAD